MDSIKENFLVILLSALACWLVLGLQQLGVSPVPASGLITFVLVVTLSFLNIGGACGPGILCGSFAGMTLLSDLLPNVTGPTFSLKWVAASLFLSFTAGGVYLLIQLLSAKYPRRMLNGYGGKLGATAFLASLLCTLMTRPFWVGGPDPIKVAIQDFIHSPSFGLSWNAFAMSMAASATGAVIPLFFAGKELFLIPLPLRQNSIYQLTANSRVIGTALWGLCVGGPLLLIPQVGGVMASSWYMGTFVSMTALELSSPLMFRLLAGLMAPWVLVLLRIPFDGLGGLLGLAALLSVCVVRRMESLWPQNRQFFYRL
jgi:hypothetical protein